jgi:hypothetical protein
LHVYSVVYNADCVIEDGGGLMRGERASWP